MRWKFHLQFNMFLKRVFYFYHIFSHCLLLFFYPTLHEAIALNQLTLISLRKLSPKALTHKKKTIKKKKIAFDKLKYSTRTLAASDEIQPFLWSVTLITWSNTTRGGFTSRIGSQPLCPFIATMFYDPSRQLSEAVHGGTPQTFLCSWNVVWSLRY